MKVRKEQFNYKKLKEIKVNECFMALRSGRHKNEVGYYLKLDVANPSKCFQFINPSASPTVAAVNLETGYVRFFTGKELEESVRVVEPYIEYE